DWDTYVRSADAVVVGRVTRVEATNDYGVVSLSDLNDGKPFLLGREECSSIGGGFFIELDDVELLAGEAPEKIEIRFGPEVMDQWGYRSFPKAEDGELEWFPDAGGGIEVGMLVGGAIFKVPGFDFYSFESGSGQPMLQISEDGQLSFQEMPRAGCTARYTPPVEDVPDRLEAFTETLRSTEAYDNALSGERTAYRASLAIGRSLRERSFYFAA
ncbi:MAG: hypothetical protein ACNA8W_15685, partial [Bradymonadaceae bacterium]